MRGVEANKDGHSQVVKKRKGVTTGSFQKKNRVTHHDERERKSYAPRHQARCLCLAPLIV